MMASEVKLVHGLNYHLQNQLGLDKGHIPLQTHFRPAGFDPDADLYRQDP